MFNLNVKSRQTLADYYDSWIVWAKKGKISPITYKRYQGASKVLHEYKSIYLKDFDRKDYQEFLAWYGQTRQLSTVKCLTHMLNQTLRDAHYDGLIKKDPTYRVKAVSEIKAEPKIKYLEYADAKKLLKYLKKEDSPKARICAFGLLTGARFSEILGLTKEDINLKDNTVDINKTYNYKEQEGFLPTKNKSSNRIIDINKEVLNFLPLHQTTKPLFVKDLEHDHFRIYNSTINGYLKRICKQLKINPITFHGLRHTHASILIAKGVSLQAVAKRLGHANTIVTQRVYVHLLREQERKDNVKIMKALDFKQESIRQLVPLKEIKLLRTNITAVSPLFQLDSSHVLRLHYKNRPILEMANNDAKLTINLLQELENADFALTDFTLINQAFTTIQNHVAQLAL